MDQQDKQFEFSESSCMAGNILDVQENKAFCHCLCCMQPNNAVSKNF